jgi:probable lipoprotein NlpC
MKNEKKGVRMRFQVGVFVGVALLLLSGCSSRTVPDAPRQTSSAKASRVDMNDRSQLKLRLYAQYREWKGTPYRLGGTTRRGADCSGFVMVTFRSKLGIDLPRTTATQVKTGTYVDRKALRTGDLVFFKTGRNVRHVGIYLEDRRFLHASTNRGVIISSLKEPYWRNHYWQARRVR